jgi:hypothetical protein
MNSLPSETDSQRAISRKKFLWAAAGATAFLGAAGRAKAAGDKAASLDAAENFTAGQIFEGNVYFKSGQPWIDVKAYGALGNGTGDDTAAINQAIKAAIVSPGTDGAGNAMVYFPPGDYMIADSIVPPNSASNYALVGAGPWSSRLVWRGKAGLPMLKLVNARGVTIWGLGFMGVPTAPSYGIEINRAEGLIGTALPTEVIVENACLGNVCANALDVAIGYTADPGQDTIPNGFGTFRDLYIVNVRTGYHFGTAQSFGNNIIGGSIAYSTSAAFDNTPGPNSSHGGNYSLFGTSTGGNAMLFRVGESDGYSIGIFGSQGESDVQLITTPKTLKSQTFQFFAGQAGSGVPNPDPNSPRHNNLYFDSSAGQLEFHGYFHITSSGGRGSFPGSAPVVFFGGLMGITEWRFNGPFQFHAMNNDAADDSALFTNLGKGTLQEFGHNGHWIGTGFGGKLECEPTATAGAAATVSVAGSDMAGTVVLTTGAAGLGAGELVRVKFAAAFPAPPVVLLMPAEPNAASIIDSIYTPSPAADGFSIGTAAAPAASTTYRWNYLVVG